MVHLADGIYCKKKVYDAALGASKASTHLVRRLIKGVFKEEILLECTATGQAPRGVGRDNQREEIFSLNPRARKAIIGEKSNTRD